MARHYPGSRPKNWNRTVSYQQPNRTELARFFLLLPRSFGCYNISFFYTSEASVVLIEMSPTYTIILERMIIYCSNLLSRRQCNMSIMSQKFKNAVISFKAMHIQFYSICRGKTKQKPKCFSPK